MTLMQELIETKRTELDLILNSSSSMSKKSQDYILNALYAILSDLEGVESLEDEIENYSIIGTPEGYNLVREIEGNEQKYFPRSMAALEALNKSTIKKLGL